MTIYSSIDPVKFQYILFSCCKLACRDTIFKQAATHKPGISAFTAIQQNPIIAKTVERDSLNSYKTRSCSGSDEHEVADSCGSENAGGLSLCCQGEVSWKADYAFLPVHFSVCSRPVSCDLVRQPLLWGYLFPYDTGRSHRLLGDDGLWTPCKLFTVPLSNCWEDHFIGGYTGQNKTAPNYTKRDWRKLMESLGIEGLTPYNCRHTFITRAIRSGMDLPKLEAIVGHVDRETTKIYTHLHANDLVEAVQSVKSSSLAVVSKLSTRPEPENETAEKFIKQRKKHRIQKILCFFLVRRKGLEPPTY